MSTGYIAAFATLIAWTISIFVFARLCRLEDSHTLNKAVLFFSIFLLGLLVCILDRLSPWELFSTPNSSNWLWLGISGVVGKSLGDYWGFSAMRIMGARRRSMIATLTPGFTWLFGLMILNETMNWLGIAAMLLTIVALLLLINNSTEKDEVKKENFGLPISGLLFGIGGAALTALAFILSKMTIVENETKLSAFHGTWIRIITAFLALMIFDLICNQRVRFIKTFFLNKHRAVLLFLGILFNTVLGLSFSLMAITHMNAAEAYSIFSLVPVSVIFVSVILYKKRLSLQSWIYSALAIAGVIVLVWRDVLIKRF